MKQTEARFSARIGKIGLNPYVDVPEEVSLAFGARGYIPVKGTLDETPVRGTLVPLAGGRHRFYINTAMRKQAGVGVGDNISLNLGLDAEPREMAVPHKLRQTLAANRAGKAGWDKITPSRQREMLAYLNSLKTPETLERNVAKVINIILASKDAARQILR